MKKSLFEIQSEYVRAIEELEQYCIDNSTDEVPDEINERLVINQDELDGKMNAYFHVVTELDGKIDTMKAYIKKMSDKKKAMENNLLRIKKYVGQALELYGEETKSGSRFYKHDLFKVTASRSSKLKVTNQELLPDTYKEEVITTSTKTLTKELKKALASGEVIEGAIIDDSTINVTFR